MSNEVLINVAFKSTIHVDIFFVCLLFTSFKEMPHKV